MGSGRCADRRRSDAMSPQVSESGHLTSQRVDAHAHLFIHATPLAAGAWHRPKEEASAQDFLNLLDFHGIGYGILAAASIFGTNNEYALEACARSHRLRTTVIISPLTTLESMKAMAASGAVGVRFQWRNVATPPDLNSSEYQQLLHNMAELGWHAQLHDDSHRLQNYLPALESAGVQIVVDHFGRPSLEHTLNCPGFQRLLSSIETGSTWVKLSSGFRLGSTKLARDAAQMLLKHAGPERLMWGSDWPFAAFEDKVSYGQTLADLENWVPDVQARDRILCQTPCDFYLH